MAKVSKEEVFKALYEGKILEYGERYYKYDYDTNQVVYSDTKQSWNPSRITVNELLKFDWNIGSR